MALHEHLLSQPTHGWLIKMSISLAAPSASCMTFHKHQPNPPTHGWLIKTSISLGVPSASCSRPTRKHMSCQIVRCEDPGFCLLPAAIGVAREHPQPHAFDPQEIVCLVYNVRCQALGTLVRGCIVDMELWCNAWMMTAMQQMEWCINDGRHACRS